MNSANINFQINKSTVENIKNHLFRCSGHFDPPLNTQVDIPEYANKIRQHSVTIEAWFSGEIVGLVACYMNNLEKLEAFITNCSVIKDFQGQGIASNLVEIAIKEALKTGFNRMSLEVDVENLKAIKFYQKAGFILSGRVGDKYKMINRLNENRDVLVSVCCVTYNHADFIKQAIEGFLMQKTTFPIEILIHDDASTDGTTEIIREYEKKYPELIFPIYQKENQYSKGVKISATYQFPRARGKYIAMCEGDDYWTDPLKLQKQVDFLEGNPEYSACFHETQQIYFPELALGRIFGADTPQIVTTVDTFSTLAIFHTSSFVFRKETINKLPDWISKVVSVDMALFSILSAYGPIRKIKGVMSVYRKHEGGITNSNEIKDTFHEARIDLMNYLDEFHQFQYSQKAQEVINFHEQEIKKNNQLLTSRYLIPFHWLRNKIQFRLRLRKLFKLV